MTDQTEFTLTCLNCGRTEVEMPLTIWRYRGNKFKICPACMPTLIHKHQEMLARWQAAGLFQSPAQSDKGD